MRFFRENGDNRIYSQADISLLEKFALLRGVRIILEIDTPSQSNIGWNWGYEQDYGQLTICHYILSDYQQVF